MRILLHTCCAPCLIAPFRSLTAQDYGVVAFFYNPNIMPYREFRKRLTAVRDYTDAHHIPAIIDEHYTLECMLRQYMERGSISRCRVCYNVRLGEAARVAAEKGFEAFTTTLLVSPYQYHDEIRMAGDAAANAHGVEFLYRDWRPEFSPAHDEAKAQNLYMQTYCGCIFSEEERYRPSVRKKIVQNRIYNPSGSVS